MSRLAYILGTFPALTETFVAGEIEALGAAGLEVELFSLLRPTGRHDHAQAEGVALAGRTCYGSGLSGRDLWAANRQALAAGPARYLRTLGAVLAHTIVNPVHCLKSIVLFPVAVAFAQRMRTRGITHVHAHWANYPTTAAYIVSRLLGVPYSFTAHAHDATLVRAMIREKIRRADFVMTCTGWTRDRFRRLVPEARARIFLNYHGVVLDRFAPALAGRPANPDRFTIVSCGSLYPRKGFPHLLEACRLLRDRGCPVDCVIVGDGPMRGELQRFIDRHQLGEQVQLVGAVAPREMVHYYRRADLFVLACMTDYLGWRELFTDPLLLLEVGPAIPFRPLTDGIPNVLVEAMATGVPVVSTCVAGIPELIEDNRTGRLVPERNADALAAAIEELLGDPERRRALARAGRAAVLERFDRCRNIQELVEIFGAHDGHRPGGTRPSAGVTTPARGRVVGIGIADGSSGPAVPGAGAALGAAGGGSMNAEAVPRDGTVLRTARLTHEQAVALLDVVAHLVDSAEVDAAVSHGSPGPSRMSALVAAMEAVGVDAAVIHAYEQTGILVGEGDEDLWSGDDLKRWEAAVTGYVTGPAPARA